MTAQRLRTGLVVLGLALVPWCWVVANTAYLLATLHGGSDEDGAATLALMAAHPELMRVALTAVTLGGILVVPAVLGFYRLAGHRLAVVIGGGLMAAGYISYAVVNGAGFEQLAMAQRGGPSTEFAAVIDAGMADPWGIWPFLLFVLGNLVGTFVLAIGLWRAHVGAPWVPLGLLAWPLLHVVGLALIGNEVPQVIGAVLQAAAFGRCALLVARAGAGDDRPSARSMPAPQGAAGSGRVTVSDGITGS